MRVCVSARMWCVSTCVRAYVNLCVRERSPAEARILAPTRVHIYA